VLLNFGAAVCETAGIGEILNREPIHPTEDWIVGQIVSDEAIEFSGVFPDCGRPDNNGPAKDGYQRGQYHLFVDTGVALDGKAGGTV